MGRETDGSVIYTVSVGGFGKSPVDGSNAVGIARDHLLFLEYDGGAEKRVQR